MSLRILVADDEPTILQVARTILEKAGFVVLSATDGPQALGMLEAQAVDVLLTDLRMPGMSGTELIVEARRRYASLPVAYMTAFIADPGLTDVPLLRKPFSAQDLINTVKKVMESHVEGQAHERKHLIITGMR
jgi:CheY-like chemotaxis protein